MQQNNRGGQRGGGNQLGLNKYCHIKMSVTLRACSKGVFYFLQINCLHFTSVHNIL